MQSRRSPAPPTTSPQVVEGEPTGHLVDPYQARHLTPVVRPPTPRQPWRVQPASPVARRRPRGRGTPRRRRCPRPFPSCAGYCRERREPSGADVLASVLLERAHEPGRSCSGRGFEGLSSGGISRSSGDPDGSSPPNMLPNIRCTFSAPPRSSCTRSNSRAINSCSCGSSASFCLQASELGHEVLDRDLLGDLHQHRLRRGSDHHLDLLPDHLEPAACEACALVLTATQLCLELVECCVERTQIHSACVIAHNRDRSRPRQSVALLEQEGFAVTGGLLYGGETREPSGVAAVDGNCRPARKKHRPNPSRIGVCTGVQLSGCRG